MYAKIVQVQSSKPNIIHVKVHVGMIIWKEIVIDYL